MTALGASFGAALRSPPGWYWYLPWVEPVSHGMLALARGTLLSDVDVVGLLPREGACTGQ